MTHLALTPAEIGLPAKLSEFRPHQSQLISQVLTSEKKIILLEAPAGIGKSVIAVTLGRLVGDKAICLTSTKALQDQYADEFAPRMLTAKGRGNFVCNEYPELVPGVVRYADRGPCVYGKDCERKNSPDCDYYGQKIQAMHSPEAVLNYAYWLAQANYTRQWPKADLLVCDEAHLIEDEIRRFASANISDDAVRRWSSVPRPTGTDAEEWFQWAADELDRGFIRVPGRDHELRKRFDSFRDAVGVIAAHNPTYDDNWVITRSKYGWVFQPVWVNALAQRYLFRHTDKALLMSATILDPDVFITNLGLDAENVDFIRAGSVFDPKRRPLYYRPVGKVKASDTASLDAVVREVDAILDAHPGENGLVHTSSYKVAQHVMEHSRHTARLLTHDTKTRGSQIAAFRTTPGAVLVSPSVTTGVDLPYDACRFQIIAKLAFPDMGDPQIKKRMKTGPDGKPAAKGQGWYNWATACNLIQAYGRGMRAEDDSCVTYLLDGNFGWFKARTKELLPAWFTEAIRYQTGEAPSVSVADQLAKIRAKSA